LRWKLNDEREGTVSHPNQVSLLELLVALDDAGCGPINTDGENIYVYGTGRIPSEYEELLEALRPELLQRLQKVTRCHCRLCRGRPVPGRPV
jgi:hypothetical protein